MTSVAPGDSTVNFMRRKVRRLTASSGESTLTTNDIDQYLNNVILNDFPYAIKIDQMRSVYTFFTRPYIDRYPLDVNFNQGVRAPVYVEGILGSLFKDRAQFYNLWPRFPTKFQIGGDSAIQTYTFTIAAPFLSKEVVIGGVDVAGNAISINDDGNGNLQLVSDNTIPSPNPVVSVPVQTTNPAKPGMYNLNTANPGLINPLNIGTVNYVSGQISFTLPAGISIANGTVFTVWVSQYQTGRPYNLLFWNNEFTIRPVPKLIHKVEVETFLTPVQFMLSTDVPILNQWAQYIAYIASMEILRDRNDFEGVEGLREGMMRQEGLVLERQAIEEIGTPNYQLFNSTFPRYTNGGWGQGYY